MEKNLLELVREMNGLRNLKIGTKKAAYFSRRRFTHLSCRFFTQYDFPGLPVRPPYFAAITGNRHSENDIWVFFSHKDLRSTQE
jgi:hypothetical protein